MILLRGTFFQRWVRSEQILEVADPERADESGCDVWLAHHTDYLHVENRMDDLIAQIEENEGKA